MTDDEVLEVVRRIEARVGLRLEVAEAVWDGNRSKAFRLKDLNSRDSFSIALELSPRRAEAFLIMDRFAGPVIRSMEAVVLSDSSVWREIIELGRAHDVRTEIIVSGERLGDDLVVHSSPWATLEIACETRRSLSGPSSTEALVEVGTTCLVLTLSALVIDSTDPEAEQLGETEGSVSHVVSTRYERSPLNRFRCMEYYGTSCWICDSNFEDIYGPIGQGFIEVHHRIPVSEIGPNYSIDPKRDLIPLCSNCHSMVHRRKPPYTPVELRVDILQKPVKPILSRNADVWQTDVTSRRLI